MPQNKTKKRKLNRNLKSKLISILLIIIAILIFVRVGKQVYTMYSLKKQAKLVEEELIKLQDENAALLSTKNKLEDPNYVTTYARGEYMFSKGDEKVFYLPSGSSDSNETSQ
ncbi:MAG: septum formation initiator family protein [Erysipelotrichaceae bacterium]|nr:septum formation initiator family protein [Erysipelotrichaceae bacterium]